jgi:hypothetical protein
MEHLLHARPPIHGADLVIRQSRTSRSLGLGVADLSAGMKTPLAAARPRVRHALHRNSSRANLGYVPQYAQALKLRSAPAPA